MKLVQILDSFSEWLKVCFWKIQASLNVYPLWVADLNVNLMCQDDNLGVSLSYQRYDGSVRMYLVQRKLVQICGSQELWYLSWLTFWE